MRSVVVARYVPWPPNSGDKQRTLAVVQALAELGEVTLCALAGPDEDPEGLRAHGVEVLSVEPRRGVVQLVQGLVRGRSLTAARFWDARLAHGVEQALDPSCDVLVLEHVQSSMYVPSGSTALRVVDMHNVESALADRVGRAEGGLRGWVWRLETRLLRRVERRVPQDDVVAVVSRADRETLSRVTTRDGVLVAPNGWDGLGPLPPVSSPTASFVALLSWGPNIGAAEWFSTQVWPLVVRDLPEATLQLVGRNPTEAVRSLAGDRVVVTGTVPSVEPWYAASMITVAPLLAGGGSRLKILESLAFGRPVVATSIGVEGLEDLEGRGVVVADDPAAMASAIVTLLSDPIGTAALGLRGAEAVAADHSWVSTLAPLMGAIHDRTGAQA